MLPALTPLTPLQPVTVLSVRYTNCWVPLIELTDGWFGSDLAQTPTGKLIPNIASDGTQIYSLKFETTTGEFRAQFGAAGNEQLSNIGKISVYSTKSGDVALIWDDAHDYYSGFNLPMAEGTALRLGENVCVDAVVVPELLIHYNFAELGMS